MEALPKDLTELNAREQRLRGEIKQAEADREEAMLRRQRAEATLEAEQRNEAAAIDRLCAMVAFRDALADHASALIRAGGKLPEVAADAPFPVPSDFDGFSEVAAE